MPAAQSLWPAYWGTSARRCSCSSFPRWVLTPWQEGRAEARHARWTASRRAPVLGPAAHCAAPLSSPPPRTSHVCCPQVLNFLYSVPQLFGIVFCPRHRLPVFDPQTGLLRPKPQPDWNLVNLTLQLFGPCGENALCVRILLFQAACCGLGFYARWALAGVYKG